MNLHHPETKWQTQLKPCLWHVQCPSLMTPHECGRKLWDTLIAKYADKESDSSLPSIYMNTFLWHMHVTYAIKKAM